MRHANRIVQKQRCDFVWKSVKNRHSPEDFYAHKAWWYATCGWWYTRKCVVIYTSRCDDIQCVALMIYNAVRWFTRRGRRPRRPVLRRPRRHEKSSGCTKRQFMPQGGNSCSSVAIYDFSQFTAKPIHVATLQFTPDGTILIVNFFWNNNVGKTIFTGKFLFKKCPSAL